MRIFAIIIMYIAADGSRNGVTDAAYVPPDPIIL